MMKKALCILIAAVVLMPFTAYAALTDNINAYYKLDGNSNDSVGSNNGSDTAITYNAGNGIIIQGAGLAPGSSSKINVAANAAFNPSGSFTLNCWIYVNAYRGDYTGWIGKWAETGNHRSYSFAEFTGGTQVVAFLYNQANDAAANVIFTRPAIGAWHMYTLVFTSGSQTEAFLDGVSKGTTSTSITAANTDSIAFMMGQLELGGETHTPDIRIDEVGLWSRALTGAEITSLYNSGAGLQYPFSTVVITPVSIQSLVRAIWW